MKKMYILLSALTILVISCSFLQNSEVRLFQSGLESLKKGDFYGAIETFSQIDSTSPYGFYGRAIAYENDRRELDALNEYFLLLSKINDFKPGIKALIKLASKTDHASLALNALLQYREIEDDSLVVNGVNAEMLLEIGEYQLAREEMAKVTSETSCNSRQHLFYSKLLLHEGDLAGSFNHCLQAIAETQDSIEFLIEAGDIYSSAGLYDSAAVYYHDALKTGKADYYQKAGIAESFIKMNYLVDAGRLIDQLEQITSENNIFPYLKTKLLLADGQNYRAKEYYQMAIGGHRITPSQFMYMAEVKNECNDIHGAMLSLESADLTAGSISYHIGLHNEIILKPLYFLVKRGDWLNAKNFMSEIEGSLPLDFETIYIDAAIGLLSKDEKASKEAITRLEILVEENPIRSVKFADLYLQIDSLEQAEFYYNQAFDRDKINVGAILGKVNVFKKRNRLKDAITFLEKLDNSITYRRSIYQTLVSLYRESGEIKKARKFVDLLLNSAPQDIDRYRLAMELAREDQSPNNQEQIVKSCLEKNPDNADALILAGNYYKNSNSNDKAEKYFRSAIPTNMKLDKIYYYIGLIKEDEGELDSAVAYYEKSTKVNEYLGKPYGRMAAIMMDRGNIENRTPTLTLIMNYVRLAKRGGINPDDYITMGRAQLIQTRFKAAGKNFQRALDIDPENPVYIFYAGMNYINLDSTQKAKTFLNKALKKGLEGELKSKARETLNSI